MTATTVASVLYVGSTIFRNLILSFDVEPEFSGFSHFFLSHFFLILE